MKTTTQHTPGPWHNIPDQPTIWDASQDTMIAKVTELPWIDGKSQWQTENANARLIAAAPELLAALEDAEFILRKLATNWREAASLADSCQRSAADAREAIAKAKGVTP